MLRSQEPGGRGEYRRGNVPPAGVHRSPDLLLPSLEESSPALRHENVLGPAGVNLSRCSDDVGSVSRPPFRMRATVPIFLRDLRNRPPAAKGNLVDSSRAKTLDSIPDAEDRLHELGLSIDLLRECLEHGQYAGDDTTPNHPRVSRGWYVWSETNRELRDALVPDGWTKSEQNNIPRTIAPDGSYCIVAVSGEEGTGTRGAAPGTKNPRGAAGLATVQENRQLELFPDLYSESDRDRMRTWYLLYLRQEDTLYAELVLPTKVDGSGSIVDYEQRIILPTIDLSPGGIDATGGDSDTPEEVDVPVEPRDA